jgi:CheY-like chemotaxis protein
VRFAIQDSGIGMSEQEMERLFQPFVQADSTIARKFGGSGLGLVISQKLTQLMHGRLEVESIKGLGSRFDVIIPAGIANLNMVDSLPFSKTESVEQTDEINDFSHARVLVAEDNVDNQYLIGLLLSRFGVSFHTVDNGQKAVEVAAEDNYDLILMDIQMPEMGGCEAVELIRQACVDCPIVALTANIMKEDIDYYLRSGFDDTLAKPIQQQDFYQTINYHLKKRNESDEVLDKLVLELECDEEIQQLKLRYQANLVETVAQVEEYLNAGDWRKLQQLAHIVKGSAGSMGFPVLTELASNVEESLLNGQFELAIENANQFIKTCEQFTEGQ